MVGLLTIFASDLKQQNNKYASLSVNFRSIRNTKPKIFYNRDRVLLTEEPSLIMWDE